MRVSSVCSLLEVAHTFITVLLVCTLKSCEVEPVSKSGPLWKRGNVFALVVHFVNLAIVPLYIPYRHPFVSIVKAVSMDLHHKHTCQVLHVNHIHARTTWHAKSRFWRVTVGDQLRTRRWLYRWIVNANGRKDQTLCSFLYTFCSLLISQQLCVTRLSPCVFSPRRTSALSHPLTTPAWLCALYHGRASPVPFVWPPCVGCRWQERN